MRKIPVSVITAALMATLLAAGKSDAQHQPPPAPSAAELQRQVKQLEERLNAIERLDQRVKALDRRVEIQQEREQHKLSELATVSATASGLTVTAPDRQFTASVHGIVQADGQFYLNGDDKTAPGGVASSTFVLNRVRPILSGTVFESYDYYLMPDFGLGKTTLQEAWFDAHPAGDSVRFEVGKFKAPFGLERLQNDKDLLFIQRGLTNNLIPNRDLGFEVHGGLLDNRLSYQLALLNGVPNNTAAIDADTNDGKDAVFRLFSLPFKDSHADFARGLGVGFAGSFGDTRGLLSKYGGGLNWYLNQKVKFDFECLRTFFDRGGPGGRNRPEEGAFLTQAQVVF